MRENLQKDRGAKLQVIFLKKGKENYK